jgi:hypothetical protein
MPLPLGVPSDGSHGDWPISGWAMLARIGGTAGSIAALLTERRATDAGALLRVMFESTVTLAWIGIDPEANARAWLRWDRAQRIKADNDLRNLGAEPLLEQRAREDFEDIVAEGPAMPNSLADRAQQADAHWSSRSAAFRADPGSPHSLRGMYRYVYRRDSQYTHAAVLSVEPLIRGTSPGPFSVVADEYDPGPNNGFTMAPIVYALALLAGGSILGIASMVEGVDAVFASHPGDDD